MEACPTFCLSFCCRQRLQLQGSVTESCIKEESTKWIFGLCELQKFNGRACSTRIAWIATIAERVPDFFALQCRLILKILKHGSVRGLSVPSFELELIGYTIALAYCIHKGLPFSAYGELAFLLIQAIILIAIIYYYSPPMGSKTWMKALVYCGLAPTVLAGKIDPGLFEILYASQHAIFFCARVPQIWKNFTNKSTGELSFLTCFMNFAGSLVRVFTSIQEKTPLSVLMGSAIGIMTNGTILSQIMMYQKPVLKKEKKED